MPLRPPSLTLSLLLIALPLLAPASPANAGDSRWRQGWGLASPVATARPDGIGQQADFAELRLQRRGGGHEAVVRNLLAGPLQVRLRYRDPGREAIAPVLLAAGEQRRLLWLADTSAPLALTLDAFPGDPGARADGYRYRLPFAGQAVRVSQGVGGRHSHQDRQNYYAIDFPLAEGTAVLAAREGTVMQALADSPQEGSLLRILHRDGSMALYGHLYPGSALVRPGQTVAVGDPLARSGSSGHSSGPHLHFAVQANRGLQLEAIPFRMDGPLGELHFARDDDR